MTKILTNNYQFREYCVLFADILNQAEKVDQLRNVPDPNDVGQFPVFVDKLRQTAGVIVAMAQIFNEAFDSLEGRRQKFSTLPADARDDFISRTLHPIDRQLFSDSMLYYLPLYQEEGQCPEWAICKLFFAAYTTYLFGLQAEHPLRGAITYGYAGVFGENGLYGPALLDAYRIESNLARYPRIVVATSLVHELQSRASKLTPKEIQTIMSAHLSQKCLQFIAQDTDGLYVIDPQGRHNSEYREIHKEPLEKAIRFVNRELVRFQSLGDAKLTSRYYELLMLLSTSDC